MLSHRRSSFLRPVVYAAVGACALYLYPRWRDEEEEFLTEGSPHAPQPPPVAVEPAERNQQRRNSFSLTNERNETLGAVDDAPEAWSWQVSDAPLPASEAAGAGGGGIRRGSNAGVRKGVRFQLDSESGFYGFVFSYEGTCAAHGGDASNVGKTLGEIMAAQRGEACADAAEALRRRFVQAAEAGGGFVEYAWGARGTLKGAYVIRVTDGPLSSRGRFFAGVGFHLKAPLSLSREATGTTGYSGDDAPPPVAAENSGLYSFAFDARGVCVAHRVQAFVGLTLEEIMARAGNASTDAKALLSRFAAAAASGGDWVEYTWRNAPDLPLRTRGAYVTALADPRPQRRPSADNVSQQADDDAHAPPPPPAAPPHIFVGFGHFGGGGDEKRSSVPPSRAAAAAATAGLQRALGTLAESSSAGSLERIVRDSDGIMAAAAAERAAWEATALPEPEAWQLPDDMHATLREHTRVQVEEFLERTF